MKAELLGVAFEHATMATAVAQILDAARRGQKGIIVTPNVDHIVMLQDDAAMRRIYGEALFRYADGMPLVWLSRIKKNPLPERVAGSDLLIALCKEAAGTGLNIYFLGGNPGIAEQAAEKLRNQFAGLKIVGTWCPPFGFENDRDENAAQNGLREVLRELSKKCEPFVSQVSGSDLVHVDERWVWRVLPGGVLQTPRRQNSELIAAPGN